MKIIIIATMFLSGCAHAYQSSEIYNSRMAALDRAYGEKLVLWEENCQKLRQTAAQDGKPLGPFAYAKCVKSLGLESELKSHKIINECLARKIDCSKRIGAEVEIDSAKLVLTYEHADAQRIGLECQANGGCANFIDLEAMYQRSHNKFVLDAYKEELRNANDQYAMSYQKERQQRTEMWSHMFDGMTARGQTNCTSFVNGSVVNTSCY